MKVSLQDLERYEVICEHDYRIDTRGSGVTLIKGLVAIGFPTFDAALTHAESELGIEVNEDLRKSA